MISLWFYWFVMVLYLLLSVFFFVQGEGVKCTIALLLGVCTLGLYVLSVSRGRFG